MKKLLFIGFAFLLLFSQQFAFAQEEKKSCIVENGQSYLVSSDGKSKELVRYCIELNEAIAGDRAVAGHDGIDLFSNYIKLIYLYGASIIGIICVLIIVVSGIQISLGGANSEFVNQGKERIMQAMLSLILLFSSALILRTVNPGFFRTDVPQEVEQIRAEESAERENQAKERAKAAEAAAAQRAAAQQACETEEENFRRCFTGEEGSPPPVNPDCSIEQKALTQCEDRRDNSFIQIDGDSVTGYYAEFLKLDPETDQAARSRLLSSGIQVNKSDCNQAQVIKASEAGNIPSCTSLRGISSMAINKIIEIGEACGSGCQVTITGGTEPGHNTHHLGNRIDLRNTNVALNNYLRENGLIGSKNDISGKCYNEGDHLHCNF